MANDIVNISVSRNIAPAPNNFQKMGAILSFGGTTLSPNTYSLLTQPSDLTNILEGSVGISSLTWSGGIATVTLTGPHGVPVGDATPAVISGVTPVGWNGWQTMTATSSTVLTFALVSNPGAMTVAGIWMIGDATEISTQVTTFFAQGVNQSIYVLELGIGAGEPGNVTLFQTWLTANPLVFYQFLLPREWGSGAALTSFLNNIAANYNNNNAKTYFHLTTTTGAYTGISVLNKCIIATVEAPSLPSTEFSAAAAMYWMLNYAPSTTNLVTPARFTYLYGVTPYPTQNNGPLLAALRAANVNYIGTGAEGGITNTIWKFGTTMDGRDFTYWYSIDWVQINLGIDLANEVINGSQNSLAPLTYNQNGIDRLQARAQGTMNRGISYGLVLGPVTVNAVDFNDYVTTNESDYPAGIYNGLSVTYAPQRGFASITMNVDVTDFPLP